MGDVVRPGGLIRLPNGEFVKENSREHKKYLMNHRKLEENYEYHNEAVEEIMNKIDKLSISELEALLVRINEMKPKLHIKKLSFKLR